MPTQYRTTVTRDPRDFNRIIVTVIGRQGRAVVIARHWDVGVGLARKYARILDAPRAVI
jgi:hypothetical protein